MRVRRGLRWKTGKDEGTMEISGREAKNTPIDVQIFLFSPNFPYFVFALRNGRKNEIISLSGEKFGKSSESHWIPRSPPKAKIPGSSSWHTRRGRPPGRGFHIFFLVPLRWYCNMCLFPALDTSICCCHFASQKKVLQTVRDRRETANTKQTNDSNTPK